MLFPSLVINRHRHLKWKALDPLEGLLMALCGLSIMGFTGSVFCDVITREIGWPWLWLQQATTGFFAWGVFIGAAAATRRNDHLMLVEITKRMTGTKRKCFEIFGRAVVAVIGVIMVIFGIQNGINDLGSFRMPSLIPLTCYTASVPISGVLIVLFCIEQIVNGWHHGFEGPEDSDDFGRIGSE